MIMRFDLRGSLNSKPRIIQCIMCTKCMDMTLGGRSGSAICTPPSAVMTASQNRTSSTVFIFHCIPRTTFQATISESDRLNLFVIWLIWTTLNQILSVVIILHELLIINFRNIVSKIRNQFVSVKQDN